MRGVEIYEGDLTDGAYEHLCAEELVAWDIETTGLDWRSDRIATCQLNAEGLGTFLVRDIQFRPERLCRILSESFTAKVFHHAPFDLKFMTYQWGVQSDRVFCTKIASRILNPDSRSESHSLKLLLRQYLSVEIDKSERLSNWLSSELTQEQVRYAANDVRYLVELLNVLRKEISAAGLMDLYAACCKFLPARVELEIGGWPDVYMY